METAESKPGDRRTLVRRLTREVWGTHPAVRSGLNLKVQSGPGSSIMRECSSPGRQVAGRQPGRGIG